MKVLLTGHQGYLGTVMAPVLRAAGIIPIKALTKAKPAPVQAAVR